MNNNNGNQFLIGTIEEGITTNTKPWATQKDSWESLVNMYQWRGRVVRKSPYSQLGQLSFVVSNQTVGAGATNFTGNIFTSHVPILTGVRIVPRFTTITVNGGANYTLTEDNANPGTIKFVSGANVPAFLNGTINYLTGALVLNFAGPPGGNVVISYSYVYALPVMGLRTRELFGLNQQDTIGFDTHFAYRFSNTADQFIPLPSVMPTEWSGTNSQFFFTTNYAGAFWATNFKPGLHGWNVTVFSGSAGIGLTATVNVTSAGNAVQVGDYVHFINLDPSLENNSGILAIVTAAGNPYTIRAIGFPEIPKTLSTTFTWTNGVTAIGIGLDSFRSIAGQDGIRYYGSLTNGTGWANYNPPIDLNNALVGSLLIFPYRGYLVFLNTWEGNEQAGSIFNYGNRARWTQIGTPYYSEPVPITPNLQTFQIDAVRDDLFGKGGANDAPTQEVIIGACFIRDILIVFFERSCWRLRFVNNAQNPFVWERINVELGSSATFSTIPFDKGAMAIGERGIIIADANDVARIDEKIPDTIFDIRIRNDGMQRVYGIRTFRTRLNYWTFPSSSNPSGIYPDLVLLYNYETKTWATFDDCFTCFGYFYEFDDMTWADLTAAWSTYDQLDFGGGNIEDGSENIIAGNQQGFVLNLDQEGMNKQPNSNFQNGASLMVDSITNGTPSIFSSKDNNLPDGSWIVLTGIAGTTSSDGVSLNGRSFRVVNPGLAPDNFTLEEFDPYPAGLASGGTFNFTLADPFIPVFPGSVNINVGTLNFTDNALNGVLKDANSLSTGFINYQTGAITLFFVPALGAPTNVYIRIVSQNPAQGFSNIETIGTYTGGGYISKTSNFNMSSKIFNFLGQDKRSRLSRIDFYTNTTNNGEFQVDILADSSNQIVNSPLSDNLRSNIVKTTLNPYQFGDGPQTMYRLYSNAVGQTLQFNLGLSDQQMAVPTIAGSGLEILALNVSLRPGGRLV
jgi:hypothetical protein